MPEPDELKAMTELITALETKTICPRCGKQVRNVLMCECFDTSVTPTSPLSHPQPAPPSLDSLRNHLLSLIESTRGLTHCITAEAMLDRAKKDVELAFDAFEQGKLR